MYADRSFKTKKALKEAVANGEEIRVFSPGPFPNDQTDGEVSVEGPNYQMHTWYARVVLKDGIIVKVT